MNKQEIAWDKEYKNPKLVTKSDEPQAETLRFFKFLKKQEKFKLEDRKILDLGCGTGRNANYLAKLDNDVIGIEFSPTAYNLAVARAKKLELTVDYRLGDIGRPYNIADNSIDVALDVTSSNSLDEAGRAVYLRETHRVLRPGGYFFVRALAKDGNQNVKNLLAQNPGREHDTYIIKEIGLTERVFSREDFLKMYSAFFKVLLLEKKTSYTKFNGRIYKRNYWIAYLQKV
ncbi:MAG: class I SAM-dependent methyltransferase [Candidatus Falkowbacteria bacterium]